jgi:hypothetical protein
LSKKDTKNNFHPQAALFYKWHLHKHDPKKGIKRAALTPSQNKTIGVHKLAGEAYDPNSVMSMVSNPKDRRSNKIIIKDDFFNLETYKISSLIPELRFYKSIGNKTIPFYFPIAAEAPKAGKPHTLGAAMVRDFSINFVGTNPYTAPRFLTAELTLYVDNVSLIFAEPPAKMAPLADLFTISIAQKATGNVAPGPSTVTSGDLRRPIEVEATLGYTFGDKNLFTQLEIEEIRESNLTLRMNVTRHDINVNQDGSATISVSYTARIGDVIGDKLFSITDSKKDTVARADIRTLLRESMHAANVGAPPPKPTRTEENWHAKVKEVRRIMEILESNKKIHAVTFEDKEIFAYAQYGRDSNAVVNTSSASIEMLTATEAERAATPTDTEAAANSPRRYKDNLDLSVRTVHYVALGDLMQAFFEKSAEGIHAAITELDVPPRPPLATRTPEQKRQIKLVLEANIEKLKKFRVLLSDINIKIRNKDPGTTPTKKTINLADIPISLALYSKFMANQATENWDKTYTIYQFLNDCVNKLIPLAIFGSFAQVAAPGIVDKVPTITSTTYTGRAPSIRMSKQPEIKPSEIPSSGALKSQSFKDDVEYFIISQVSDREFTTDGSGNKKQDSQKGVYHFEIGKDRGLIKEINFSRFDAPYAQEQLMTNQVGLYDELKLPYKASITMVGNNLFMPGSQIYINPSNIGFGLPTDTYSAAHRLGIGGYYTVLSVSTNISNGVASTELECSFGAHASKDQTLTSAVPLGAPADEVERGTPSPDSIPVATGIEANEITSTGNLESKLLTAELQLNLAKAIADHFANHASTFDSGEERWPINPPMGVDRLRQGRLVLRYYINSGFDPHVEYVDIHHDENNPSGQVQTKLRLKWSD